MVEKKRKTFVKRMVTALILGVILGIVISLLKPYMSESVWNLLNKLFFQDITVSEGRNAIGLFYIVQTVFTNALKLAIVPMVFFSIIMSVCGMNDMRKLGRIAGKTIITFVLFYLVACFFAAVVSELVINMGLYREFVVDSLAADVTEAETSNILVTIVNAVPDNMISALGNNNKMLAVITCSVVIGVSIAAMGDKIQVFRTFCDECSQIVQKFLDFLIIVCSPFSVFCMITRTFAIYGIDQVSNIFSYIIVTIITLIIYLLVAYPIAMHKARSWTELMLRAISHEALIGAFCGLVVMLAFYEAVLAYERNRGGHHRLRRRSLRPRPAPEPGDLREGAGLL